MKTLGENQLGDENAGQPAQPMPAPPVTLLPELSAEEKLQQRVMALEADLAERNKELKKALGSVLELDRQNGLLGERLGKMEKNTLIQALAALDSGVDLERFGGDLEKVVEAVGLVGGKGSVTLKVQVKQMEGKADGALVVSAACSTSLPKEPAAPALFYPLEGGGLSRRNPRQREMEFSRSDRSSEVDGAPYKDEPEDGGKRVERRGK